VKHILHLVVLAPPAAWLSNPSVADANQANYMGEVRLIDASNPVVYSLSGDAEFVGQFPDGLPAGF